MSLDLEFGTAFESTPEIRHEKKRADVILSKNNNFETLRNKEITIMFDTGNFVNLEIDGMSYQVIKKIGSKLFHTRPKYTTQESFVLPMIIGLLGFSTFYNVQFYFQAEDVITLSNTYLFLLFIGASIGWGIERNLSKSELIFLKQQYKTLVPIDLGSPIIPDMVRHYYQHRGYTLSQIFGAVGVGITLLAPIALSDIAYQIDYFVSWMAAAIAFSVVMNKSLFTKESEERLKNNTPLIYSPHVVEPIFENNEEEKFKGFRRLGLLVDIKGDTKEARKASIDKIESHYKNKRLVGFKEVIETENALETPEQTFQGYISEAYRDENKNQPEFRDLGIEEIREVLSKNIYQLGNDQSKAPNKKPENNVFIESMAQGILNHYNTIKGNETDEVNFVVSDITEAKAALEKSIQDLAPTKKLQALLLEVPENNFLNKTTKDILLYYDRLVRLLQNDVAYLVQENKNRESVSISDKKQMRNLRAALHSQMANKAKSPEVKEDIDRSGLIKMAIVGITSIILLLIFVWAVDNGVL